MTTATKKAKAGNTVLVVDDNAAVRSEIRSLFLSDGFSLCAEAANGLEAIQVAKECQPTVIILDAAMPVMNGFEAAPKLREIFPKIPIILFTLHGDALKNHDLSSLGISAICAKSDNAQHLLQKVHELIGE